MITNRNEAIGITINSYTMGRFKVKEYLYDDSKKEIHIIPNNPRICPRLCLLNYAESLSFFDEVMSKPNELMSVQQYMHELEELRISLMNKHTDLR